MKPGLRQYELWFSYIFRVNEMFLFILYFENVAVKIFPCHFSEALFFWKIIMRNEDWIDVIRSSFAKPFKIS
jgi:hypothetical protein